MALFEVTEVTDSGSGCGGLIMLGSIVALIIGVIIFFQYLYIFPISEEKLASDSLRKQAKQKTYDLIKESVYAEWAEYGYTKEQIDIELSEDYLVKYIGNNEYSVSSKVHSFVENNPSESLNIDYVAITGLSRKNLFFKDWQIRGLNDTTGNPIDIPIQSK